MRYSANLNNLLNAYERDAFSLRVDRAAVLDVIAYGIRNGFLVEIEQKHTYMFGGVALSLTDSEFAAILTELHANRKVSAIKLAREIGDISLLQAKTFMDHLGDIVSKVTH